MNEKIHAALQSIDLTQIIIAAAGTLLATRTLQNPSGATIRARGEAAVTDRVFVRDGAIEGPAPSLTVVPIDI